MVQAGCRSVLQGDLEELANALSMEPTGIHIIGHADPDRLVADVDGQSAELGVKFREPGKWRLLYCLHWHEGSLRAKTSVRINRLASAEEAYRKLKRKEKENYPVSLAKKKEIYIFGAVGPDQVASFAEVLETVSAEWVDLCQRTGGLNQFLT